MAPPEYELQTDDRTINWFLDTVLVEDIEKVIRAGAGYLAFSLIAQGIEVLGALLDEQDFHKSGLSEDRFGKAITELFRFKPQYATFNRPGSEFYLWENLRCGMAHILRPKPRLLFTGSADAQKLGFEHLSVIQPAGYESKQLLLVLETFHADFAEACRRAKNVLKKKTNPKLKQGYIAVTVFSYDFVNAAQDYSLNILKGSNLHVQTPPTNGGFTIAASVTGSYNG